MSRRKSKKKNAKKRSRPKSAAPKIPPEQPVKQWPVARLSLLLGLPLLVLAGYLFLPNRQNELFEDASDPAATASLQQAVSDGSPMKLDSGRVEAQQKKIQDQLDPLKDDWETEDFAEKAGSQLKRIAKMMAHAHDVKDADFEGLLSKDFQCEPLRPHSTEEAYNDGAIVVRRVSEEGALNAAAAAHSGAAGLREAIVELTEGLQDASSLHAKFKLFRVNPDVDGIETTQYFQMSGELENAALARNATWYCRWTLAEKGAMPKLTSIRVSDYEEVKTRGPSQTIFSDCTEGVLGETTAYQENLRYGTDYWIQRLEKRLGTIGFGHTGLAIADVNGDELADVYLCQPGGLPNCLLIQQPDGTAKDMAAQSGVDILDYARSALFADFDNDGDQDLVVSLSHLILIHANDGQGRFSLVTKLLTGGPGYSIAATDYDNDGNLDFYICSQNIPMANITDLTIPVPYYDANNGGENYLFRNEGKLKFRDVTEEVGLNQNNQRFSFAAAWEDYDNDGDEDLYVANDFGRNNLYRNDDGHFTDVAASAGVEDIASGMSVTWGDANHDGLMDLYVSNMFSAAGQRTTFQKQYRNGVKEDALPKIQRLARGNSLFMNQGDGTFREESLQAGVTLGRWAWCSLFVDINNDSWSDLVVTNGFMSKSDTGDL